MKYDAQHMKLHGPHIDTVLVLSGMEYVNREQLAQRRYQTCRRQATNETTELCWHDNLRHNYAKL